MNRRAFAPAPPRSKSLNRAGPPTGATPEPIACGEGLAAVTRSQRRGRPGSTCLRLRNKAKLQHPHPATCCVENPGRDTEGLGTEVFFFPPTGLASKQTSQEGKCLEFCRWAGPRTGYWRKEGNLARSDARRRGETGSLPVACWGKHARASTLVLLSPCPCPGGLPKEQRPDLGIALLDPICSRLYSVGTPGLPSCSRILSDEIDHSTSLSPKSYHARTSRRPVDPSV